MQDAILTKGTERTNAQHAKLKERAGLSLDNFSFDGATQPTSVYEFQGKDFKDVSVVMVLGLIISTMLLVLTIVHMVWMDHNAENHGRCGVPGPACTGSSRAAA